MSSTTIAATDGSGSFTAFVVEPKTKPAGAVVVIQEIFGVNQAMRDTAAWIADLGFIAICPDLFWRIEPGIDITDKSEAEWKRAFELFKAFDQAKGIEDLKATVTAARTYTGANGKVATIGYCLGGRLAFMMAEQSDADLNISYYGVGLDGLLSDLGKVNRPLIVHIADKDEYFPPAGRAAVVAATKDHKHAVSYVYPNADHAFARVNGVHWDGRSAAIANGRSAEALVAALGLAPMDDAITPAPVGRGLAKTAGALAGIKVIDLTRVLGGPYCTMILSDHGAEVIKIEPPQGDEVRDWGPPFHEGDASYFIGVNRNKRSIGLDLSKPQGRSVLLRLLEGADVLIENFKPGAMEKWDLGYEDVLSHRFPGLIHCRVSGFGADGPLGGLPGYDAILQAMTGLMSVNGDATTGPMRLGAAIVDMGTGLYSAIGILMALHERGHSGKGQYLDMALYDCGLALLHPQAANFFLNGKRPTGTGNPHPNLVPYDKYPTKTCEIFIASGNNGQFRKLAEIIGRPDLADDPRFVNNGERNINRVALTLALAAAFADQDGHELSLRLIRAGVPAGPVLPVDESTAAPHAAHREMVTQLDWYKGIGTPIKFSRTKGGTRRPPPKFNQHGTEVLSQHGYSDAEIGALQKAGVLHLTRRI